MSEPAQPPYLRIAAELRRQVADGELPPGARVPSTRQLSREWHVALATATKALATLRQEGVVQARPRAGTVVAATPSGPEPHTSHAPTPSAPAGPARPGTGGAPARRAATGRAHPQGPAEQRRLSRDRLVRAAIRIADTEGLAAVSMRGVAARLGASPMSPYRHVHGRDELVLLMTDRALGELRYPAKPPRHWRARLESGARALWALHRAHPWLAHTGPLTRPLVPPNLLAYSEWMLDALDGHGLSPHTMFHLNALLYSQVQGLAVHLEREAQAESATGLTDQQWLAARTEPELAEVTGPDSSFPVFSRVLGELAETGYDLQLDDLFETGLQSVLDRVATLIADAGGPGPAPGAGTRGR